MNVVVFYFHEWSSDRLTTLPCFAKFKQLIFIMALSKKSAAVTSEMKISQVPTRETQVN